MDFVEQLVGLLSFLLFLRFLLQSLFLVLLDRCQLHIHPFKVAEQLLVSLHLRPQPLILLLLRIGQMLHLRLQVLNPPHQFPPLILLHLPHLCQLVPEFLFDPLKHDLLLRHFALHVLELLGQVLARVLPLPAHLPLGRLERRDLRPQLPGLAVAPVYLVLQGRNFCPLQAQFFTRAPNFALQLNKLVARTGKVAQCCLTRRFVGLGQVLELSGLITQLLVFSHKGLQFVLGLVEGLGEGLEVFLLGFAPLRELIKLPEEGLVLVHYFVHSKV